MPVTMILEDINTRDDDYVDSLLEHLSNTTDTQETADELMWYQFEVRMNEE